MATNDTNSNDKQRSLTFYPAFCFKASPTHFTWVKIGAADIHRLKKRAEFGDQGLFFYLNHPIRFVNLIGIIVARVDVPRRTILTLDDSSGATIDVAVLKSENDAFSVPFKDDSNNEDANGNGNATRKETHITSTTHAPLNITPLQPGTLIQIKGTMSVFRSTIQIQLERFFTVSDTKAEMGFLEARCRFFVEVLSIPWVLGEGDIEGLRDEADEEERRVEDEQDRVRRRGRRRAEREEREWRKIEKMWEREDVIRERDARMAKEAGLELMREIEWGRAKRTA